MGQIKLDYTEYTSRTAGGVTIYRVSLSGVYKNDDGTGRVDTTFSFTWFTDTVQVEKLTTTLPAVGTSQNGSGTSNTREQVFDIYGNLIWIKDERGFITRNVPDIVKGGVTQTIEDVDTTQTTDEPSGWTTPSGGGLHVTSDFDLDDLGRVTESRSPSHTVDIAGTATSVRTCRIRSSRSWNALSTRTRSDATRPRAIWRRSFRVSLPVVQCSFLFRHETRVRRSSIT